MPNQAFPREILPDFTAIDPANIATTIRQMLDRHRARLKQILTTNETFNWDNLLAPLEEMNDELNKYWSPIGHLHGVMETESLRKAYNETMPLLTEYSTEMAHNTALYEAIQQIADRDDFKQLHPAQRKIIENELRDFKLAGINLSPEKKHRIAELYQQISQLTTKFSENLLDATHAYTLHLTEAETLAGLPEQALQLAREQAEQRKLPGYVITLDYPAYSAVMRYAHHRDLRKSLYEAHITRASDVGPNAQQFDNTKIMHDIIATRDEIAHIVGFENYAALSLATKMAPSTNEVMRFLTDLLKRSLPLAKAEHADIAKLAKDKDHIEKLESWDGAYYSELLRANLFNFTQEELRPYFPINHVLSGLFGLVSQLYGLKIQEETGINTWHPDVKFFSIYDTNHELRGGFYIDLYARAHKRDGAWMDDCLSRRRLKEGGIQYPVAYLTCNFMPPVDGNPALLTHDDVITLFHEFGHCLHHLLTKVDYLSVSGIHGVAWDAVEFPSQFMENYCWEKASLDLIAKHYQTGAPLPDELYQKMNAAKHFQDGLQMVRQLEFAIFDFRIHLEYDPAFKGNQIQCILDDVRKQTALTEIPKWNRFQNSFSHIFAGGYAAGYYSYKWAEVLSADAYSKFEENGIFDPATGRSFMENILEVGGMREPLASFVAFRGREPTIDALLRQSGIEPAQA